MTSRVIICRAVDHQTAGENMPKPVIISYETARILAQLLPDASIKLGSCPLTLEGVTALRDFWRAFNLSQEDEIDRLGPPPTRRTI
jgi:hypothetical protein